MSNCPFIIELLGAVVVLLLHFLFHALPSAQAQQQRLDRCFDGTNFITGSQGCADDAASSTTEGSTAGVTAVPICEAFFGTEPTAADVASNTHPCYMPGNKAMASKCRRRCKTCCLLPEYGSCNDQPSGDVPCTSAMCAVERFAVKVCPQTCGGCVKFLHSREETKYCADEEDIDNCVMLKESGMCATSADAAAMCALTCNNPQTNNQLCEQYTRNVSAAVTAMTGGPYTPRPNGDLSDDCPTNKHLCDNEVYEEMMHRYCSGTCAEDGGCADRSENCLHWKRNGFCENEFYTLELRIDQCGESCGLC